MMWSGQIFKAHGRESPHLEVSCHLFFLPQSVMVGIADVKDKNTHWPLQCLEEQIAFISFIRKGGGEKIRENKDKERLMREDRQRETSKFDLW